MAKFGKTGTSGVSTKNRGGRRTVCLKKNPILRCRMQYSWKMKNFQCDANMPASRKQMGQGLEGFIFLFGIEKILIAIG
jgi:hypothetical protein